LRFASWRRVRREERRKNVAPAAKRVNCLVERPERKEEEGEVSERVCWSDVLFSWRRCCRAGDKVVVVVTPVELE